MANIGSFAGVAFEVSSKKAIPLKDYSRSSASRWETHEVTKHKPIPEFIGQGQEQISFSIRLSVYHGVNPEKELAKLRSFRDNGKVASFILGTKPISKNYWYIDSINESTSVFGPNGQTLTVDVEITLFEYPKTFVKKKKNKPKSKKKISNATKKKVTGTIKIKSWVYSIYVRASPSLKGKPLTVARKNQVLKVFGTKKTDITWYDLGGGRWISANSKYSTFTKG
ncbi:phage tail protein [Mesobacillus thioparans]|uniref:phage tail protein n=1 Tax=Mesobacillus thioparans TaxID=370439 RepID=UPI0039F03CFA